MTEGPPCFQCGQAPRRGSPFCSAECEAAFELGEVRPWGCRCCHRDVIFAGHVYMLADELWARTGRWQDLTRLGA